MSEDILKSIVKKITSLDWNLKTVDGKPHPFIDLLNETPFDNTEQITLDYLEYFGVTEDKHNYLLLPLNGI